MKKIIFFISILFIFISCSNELITVVDEYNPPYGIKAIPGSNSISISFWSGILASDFVGFNLYAGTSSNFNQPNDAITNSAGSYPTVANSTHTRSSFTFPISGTYNNGTLYYVTVTAYGTNDLIDTKYIETKINAIVPVIPRAEGDVTGNTTITASNQPVGTIDTSNNKINSTNGWKVQSFGPQSDFNAVVVITNNIFYTNAEYSLNGLYIFSNGNNGLAKVWITNTNGSPSYHWAYHDKANLWLGI